eukprot:366891-Rhodomonas_salina.2
MGLSLEHPIPRHTFRPTTKIRSNPICASTQSLALVAPSKTVWYDAPQREHAVAPELEAYCPVGHGLHGTSESCNHSIRSHQEDMTDARQTE